MSQVMTAYSCNDDDVQELVMLCLKELSVAQYEQLVFYFDSICQLIGQAMTQTQNEKVAAQGFEFWNELAEAELERSKSKSRKNEGYVERSREALLDLVLKGLLVINFDEGDDGDEQGTHISSWHCLMSMAALLGD